MPRQTSKHRYHTPTWDAPDLWHGEMESTHAYVIVSTKCKSVYTGSSSLDPEDRLAQHNKRNVKSTVKGAPEWRHGLVVKGFPNKTAASRFESLLKNKGRAAGLKPKYTAAMHALNSNVAYGQKLTIFCSEDYGTSTTSVQATIL
jgi:predicted GIY-YIG superfamily endonuclease